MSARLIGQSVGLFAVTNIDDMVVLALLFGQTPGRAGALTSILGKIIPLRFDR